MRRSSRAIRISRVLLCIASTRARSRNFHKLCYRLVPVPHMLLVPVAGINATS